VPKVTKSINFKGKWTPLNFTDFPGKKLDLGIRGFGTNPGKKREGKTPKGPRGRTSRNFKKGNLFPLFHTQTGFGAKGLQHGYGGRDTRGFGGLGETYGAGGNLPRRLGLPLKKVFFGTTGWHTRSCWWRRRGFFWRGGHPTGRAGDPPVFKGFFRNRPLLSSPGGGL